MTGTLLNVSTVIIGSSLGLVLGKYLTEHLRDTVLKGLGLLTLVIGMHMTLKTGNILILMGSILVGGICGEVLDLQGRLDRLGKSLQLQFSTGDARFSEGFITASIVFCVGPMTVLGSIQDGLSGDYQLLAVKSMLDGFSSLALAAVFGPGVLFSVITVLLFQGGITLGAGSFEVMLSPAMIDEMTASGGLMILGIGFVILDITRPRVANFLPGLVVSPALTGGGETGLLR